MTKKYMLVFSEYFWTDTKKRSKFAIGLCLFPLLFELCKLSIHHQHLSWQIVFPVCWWGADIKENHVVTVFLLSGIETWHSWHASAIFVSLKMHVSVCAKRVKKIDESNEVEEDVVLWLLHRNPLSFFWGAIHPPHPTPALCWNVTTPVDLFVQGNVSPLQ